jgi:hypothetical protein
LLASGNASLRNERGSVEEKDEKFPGLFALSGLSLGTFGRYTQSTSSETRGPLSETWDEQGVLQLRLAIDGEFWAFFPLLYCSVATGEADCDGFYCTCMHRGRQDGLTMVFSLCEYEAINTIQRLTKPVENDFIPCPSLYECCRPLPSPV